MAFDASSAADRRFLDRGDARLHVLTAGPSEPLESGADSPVVVFVHGYPDTHAVWLPVIERLADHLRCVAYDVRGAGGSTAPAATAGYRLDHLVSDLAAVIDDASPDHPVHLVGHDWGSVQAWEAVLLAGCDPRLQGRIASYTTISGPAPGHFAGWILGARRGSWARRRAVLRQLRRSWYILAFQLPWLPERLLRRLLSSPSRARRLLGSGHSVPTVVGDAVNGLGLYRANLRGGAARHSLRTRVPVQLIVPTRDAFLTPTLYDDLPRWCPNLTRHDLDAGHWVQVSHADRVADLVADFVARHDPSSPLPTEHPPSAEFGHHPSEFDGPAVSGGRGAGHDELGTARRTSGDGAGQPGDRLGQQR